MYSKEEVSKIKQTFWTTFGQYMTSIPSSDGMRINWINYKTGFKHLFFKMDVGKKDASIFIDISHPDLGIQELFFEQFKEFKKILEGTLNEEWIWELHTTDEHGKVISRIYKQLQPVSIFEQTDWPAIISFLKPRIMGLDEFWSMVKDSFEALK
ncbi:DUF4268 domain-containing protein [Olivibacter sp. XZL3]|uniref:DUF4268 domain-containing protein n=1 Tax=Olivibacter sp. XZL3 TaxID=1735116 RepID=UPI00106480F3|nr:DUF4268 domain-containing protein [Olivibacter sp. XZL3]